MSATAVDTLKALVVDSDQKRSAELSEVLKGCGYSTQLAVDAKSAKALVEAEEFNVVLCKDQLAAGTAVDVLKELREANPQLPFVVIADDAQSPIVAEAMKAGASDSFTTPGDYTALFPKLAALQAAVPGKTAVHPVQLPELQATTNRSEAANVELIMDVPVDVKAVLGTTTMRIADLLQLGTGSIVELDKRAGEPAELFVNDKLVALGEVVVVDDTFGIRITEVIDAKQRVQVLS